MKYHMGIALFSLCISLSHANSPSYGIHWPVGSTESQMNNAKTLMASYGDPVNGWGTFHNGIDIDSNTELVNGNYVRCVEDGIIARLHFDNLQGGFLVVVPTLSSERGWCYGHLENPENPNPENPTGWQVGQEIHKGDLIQLMWDDPVITMHTHFNWVNYNEVSTGFVNPLDYLTPEAEDSNYWEFNPDELTPAFVHMFLPEKYADDWADWTVEEAQAVKIDEDNLSGNVDFFFGISLQGEEQGDVCSYTEDCSPERVYWELTREIVPSPELLSENYVVNFDCILDSDDDTSKILYFKHFMADMFTRNGVLMCLTNCGDDQGWENLGISNIDENSWRTNKRYNSSTAETFNPILAEYSDGSYSIDVTCYSHTNDPIPSPPDLDPAVSFYASIPCELHNFAPALSEVFMVDAATDETHYHGKWEPITSGLEAELIITEGLPPAEAGASLDVVMTFTETMTTSSLSASLGPLSIGDGVWSSSVVLNDTWTGEVTLPSEGTDGFYILSVSATDTDGNSLMNPEGVGSIPDPPAPDTHHEISMGFGVDLDWSVTLPEPIRGSIALDDIDGDGYMELAVQTEEGTVHIYNHDGSVLSGWPKSNTGYYPSYDEVHITPALGDVNNDGYIDVVSGYHCGSMAWNATGNTLSGWPFMVNGVEFEGQDFAYSSPVLCNLNSDDALEAVVCRQLYNLPPNGPPESVFALDSDGSEIWRCNLNPSNDGESVMGTPVVVDVTGDASPEILVCSSTSPSINKGKDDETDAWLCDGRLYLLSGTSGAILSSSSIVGEYVFGSPAVGDIDGDSSLEVVISCLLNPGGLVKTYVFSLPTLTLEHSWSLTGGAVGPASSPALGDIDNSGSVDVIVYAYNTIFAWDGETKNPISGFPVNVGSFVRHGVSLADIDGDNYPELVFCTQDGYLRVLNHDGSICGGFPICIGESSMSQPAIDDIDGDGRLEICVTNTLGEILVYEAGESSWPALLTWPQYQHDARNSGILAADFDAPAAPTDFEGNGGTAGLYFTANLSWTMSVNDPNYDDPLPTPPADVSAYRIYRMAPPRPIELIATISAGVESYTDVIPMSGSLPPAICYYASAWDGVNESELSTRAKIAVYGSDNIAAGCPVREIIHSDAIAITSTHSAILAGTSSVVDLVNRNGCRILTDGEYDAAYIPSSSSDCIEIDLGKVCTVRDVIVIRDKIALTSSTRYELSVDGRTFADSDTGRARYIRVYSVAGASEIEVSGSLSGETSALVEIQRSTDSGYLIASVESGAPITATVFDLSGRNIWQNTSSTDEVLWNSCSSSGNTVPAGVYLIMVESDDIETFTSKVVVR